MTEKVKFHNFNNIFMFCKKYVNAMAKKPNELKDSNSVVDLSE